MRFAPPALLLPSEDETRRLARSIAPLLRVGDVLLLDGPVGAGKSAFARALIRARLDAPDEDVPSPTFTLVQTYPHSSGDIWHADLYRLTHPDEARELGLDDAFDTAICLIEWPDRLGSALPDTALSLGMAAGDDAHTVRLTGDARWLDRLGAVIGGFETLEIPGPSRD